MKMLTLLLSAIKLELEKIILSDEEKIKILGEFSLLLTSPNKKIQVNTDEEIEKAILEVLKNEALSGNAIQNKLGIKSPNFKFYLENLLERGIIHHNGGNKKASKYYLKELDKHINSIQEETTPSFVKENRQTEEKSTEEIVLNDKMKENIISFLKDKGPSSGFQIALHVNGLSDPKTRYKILNFLVKTGIINHNNKKANASKYFLTEQICVPNSEQSIALLSI